MGNLFAPLAMKVAGGIIAALAVGFAVQTWRVNAAHSTIEDQGKAIALGEAKLAISNQSILTLETALRKFVGAGRARRVAQLAAIEAQAPRSAAMRREAERIRAELAEMRPGDPCDCSTPDFVMEGR